MTPEQSEDFRRRLEEGVSGFFNSCDTIKEANEYAQELLKSSSKDERALSTQIAIGVYHNTLVKNILGLFDSCGEDDEKAG